MLDLLLLAYTVRCVLEYRIDQRVCWLTRMSFVYGLATTNNWAMIGFFPVMLAAVIWVRGFAFFQVPFLLRMIAWGVAGLLPYFILPLILALQGTSNISFFEALRLELVLQKRLLTSSSRLIALFGSLTSVLPLFIIGVRWPSSTGDTTAIGSVINNYIFRFVYALFLVAGLWVVLDAPFSPRIQMANLYQRLAESIPVSPFLTFYYLGALALGYFVGYFQLVFGRSEDRHRRKAGSATRVVQGSLLAAVLIACTATVGASLWRNLPAIRAGNGRLLKDFAATVIDQVPKEPALLLSDQPQVLTLVHTLLSERGQGNHHLLVDTRFLEYPTYHRELHRRAPKLWPDFFAGTNLPPYKVRRDFLMFAMGSLVREHRAYYLHPSFGYFFEPLYLEPHALLYRLVPYETNMVSPPALSPDILRDNTEFWNRTLPRLQTFLPAIRENSPDAKMVGRWYSHALNHWGVTLQRQSTNAWATTAPLFQHALALNRDNLSAEVNLAYNQSVQAGNPRPLDGGKSPTERLGTKYRTWSDVLRISGPADDPRLCFELGQQFYQQSLHRQASQQFQRCLQLAPGNNLTRLWLIFTYSAVRLHDQVLAEARELRQRLAQLPLAAGEEMELTRLEGQAMNARGDADAAERHLLQGLQRHPGARPLIEALVEVYLLQQQEPKALALLQEQMNRAADIQALLITKAIVELRLNRYQDAGQSLAQVLDRNPEHPQALLTQGALHIQAGQFTNALPPLNRLLELQPGNIAARLNRAIAFLQSGQLNEAEADYIQLLEILPTQHQVHYGLAEIASQRKDTPKAIRHYEAYLFNAPPDTEEARQVTNRLATLKAAQP
jgi:tetratricopeptide (TPR) repeat protein